MRLTLFRISTRRLAGLALIGVAVLVIGAMTGAALADTRSPFGVGIAETAPAASSGIFGWIAQQQRAMYRGLTGAIRAIHDDGFAVIGLASLSFLYGVFHAAGPGHGKAVIASYLLANNETLKRGIVLSFASAFVQASVAVSIVLVAALVFNATARTMTQAAYSVEVASYSLVLALGLYLVWTKALRSGAVFTREPPARALGAQAVAASTGADAGSVSQPPGDATDDRDGGPNALVHRHGLTHGHDHDHHEHDHHHHDHDCGHGAGCDHGVHHHHDHDDHASAGRPMMAAAQGGSGPGSAIHTPLPVLMPAVAEPAAKAASPLPAHRHGGHPTHDHHHHTHDHGHADAHDDACGCGHSHAPDPRQLEGAFDWRRGIAVVFAAGLRPCSGAIIVLVFALSQGLLWAGVASAYAMALGTGITVAALAALAVSGSALAVRLAGRGSPWAGRIHRTVEIGGSLAVLALGIILVGGALSGDGSL